MCLLPKIGKIVFQNWCSSGVAREHRGESTVLSIYPFGTLFAIRLLRVGITQTGLSLPTLPRYVCCLPTSV